MFEIRAVDPEGIIARLVVFHEGLTDVVSRFDDCASSDVRHLQVPCCHLRQRLVAESGRPGRAELLAKRPHGRLRRLSAELENVGEASDIWPTF